MSSSEARKPEDDSTANAFIDGEGKENAFKSEEYDIHEAEDDAEQTDGTDEKREAKLKKSNSVESTPGKDDKESSEAALMRFADSIRTEEENETDPEILAQMELIEKSTPTTDLEIALSNVMKRKVNHLNRLTAEIVKLKNFISKRKQTYKRKRKDDGAPTRALSAYNIFIQERFALLAKQNEKALKSESDDVTLTRVPPAHLVAATGNVWKSLSAKEKQKYEEKYVFSIRSVPLCLPYVSQRFS
jgi:HMG-box domain